MKHLGLDTTVWRMTFVAMIVCCAAGATDAWGKAVIEYDAAKRTITIKSGQATLKDIAAAVVNPAVFRQNVLDRKRKARTSIMTATLRIESGAGLTMANETLKFNCSKMVEFGIINHGSLRIANSHITSVKKDARGWIKNDGGKGGGYAFNVTDSEFSLLGFIDDRPESVIPIPRRRPAGTFWYPITCMGKTAEPLVFRRNVMHHCDLAIRMWQTSKARVIGNTFRNIRAFINGPYYPNPKIKRLSMVNNFGAIEFWSGNKDLLFAHNKVHDIRRDDKKPCGHIIRVSSGQKKLVIEKNEIYNSDGDEAILLKHTSGVTVRDNYIHDITFAWSTGGWGIMIYKGYREGQDTVVNNRIENCRGGIAAYYDAGAGNIIKGNWISGCYRGITLSGTLDNVVADNVLSSCLWSDFTIGDIKYRGRRRITKNLRIRNNLLCGEKTPTIKAKGDVKLSGNVMLGNDMAAKPGPPAFKVFLVPRTVEVGEKVSFMVIPLEPLTGNPTATIEAPGLKKLVMKLDRFRGPKKTVIGGKPVNRFAFTYTGEFDTRGARAGKAKITVSGKDKSGQKGSTAAGFTIVGAAAKAKPGKAKPGIVAFQPGNITVKSGTARLADLKAAAGKAVVRKGKTYTVTASITVAKRAKLVIRNETLRFNCSRPGQYALVINGGLEVEKSKITTVDPANPSYIDCFNPRHVARAWSFKATDSTISNMGVNSLKKDLKKHAIIWGHGRSAEGNIPAKPAVLRNCVVENCRHGFLTINEFGKRPAKLYVIDGNTFRHMDSKQVGNGGIINLARDMDFTNNTIHHVRCGCYVVWIIGKANVLLSGNEMHNCSTYVACIGSKHAWNLTIRDNYIHDTGGKCTAILIYKGWVYDNYEFGDTVVNNRIEKCNTAIGIQYYTRPGRGNVFRGNVIADCPTAVSLLGGRENLIEKNTFVRCARTFRKRPVTYRKTRMPNENNTIRNNKVITSKKHKLPKWRRSAASARREK